MFDIQGGFSRANIQGSAPKVIDLSTAPERGAYGMTLNYLNARSLRKQYLISSDWVKYQYNFCMNDFKYSRIMSLFRIVVAKCWVKILAK